MPSIRSYTLNFQSRLSKNQLFMKLDSLDRVLYIDVDDLRRNQHRIKWGEDVAIYFYHFKLKKA